MEQQTKQNLRIIPLGGCEEVGRNMTVFEYKKDILILDMGLQFPEEDMPGIDYVIPNIEYLKGKERNIQGVIFSHGHLDHIGAAPILLKKLGNPFIIGRPLTIEMIKHRQEDFSKGSSKTLRTTYINNIQKKMHLGSFTASFFRIDHSIMDAVGTIIETPVATVIHPGDWMIEHKPTGRDEIEYTYLAKLKRPTILMLESLGSTNSKKSVTEEQMLNNLYNLITSAPGRIIITTFSSQILRIKEILDYASRIGKKVALDGFSMKLNMEIAKKLGYIKVEKDTIIPIGKIMNFPNNKIIVICTGAQGEEMSALSRIVSGDHRFIKIRKSDTIVFSSSVIPGNERTIQRLKDNIYRLSDHVLHSDIMDVHASGHSNIEDIKNIISQIKPDYFIPVYANHFMLKEAAKIAYNMGFPEDKVFVPDNGSIIQFNKKGAEILKEKVPTNYIFVDGLGVGDVGEIVLRDRQMLAKDGMFVIVAVVDKQTGKVKGSPDIISRGFVYLRESKELLQQTRKKVIETIEKSTTSGGIINWIYTKNKVRNTLGDFLFQKTQRRPMVLPVIIEV
ncbi:MAG: ribonuclease J [Candidatus Nealsonbacteria bacterium CG_4_9_14_3_um_filter_35_11]|uniref:Ribonuclease J n=2 Tax=Candidatus Nealsoniibacteriota TaxID=1817911 RepID=A0A2M7DAW2_9BACT|nr:MAG: ribonuclease J [Candidatus Nealsonbacteria bacterium CG11_big_fil_rev_8_21_14_0_20_35_11]PIV45598.1 MAG: ribonuclease J [Candidatus Nealsonbacteria bacterium CG02_land_8_20_14_3_00_34_20]PIW92488.1 MAG: ribonuclease J [Candidatus Nealsonbacteria bacterium CG_4_8_14_3_um_filter_34_13]PIZ89882.1 MAG: ribonuclease J [Candidatus Nealsonbacteria bacterium CG_4_10_14_0_2_um_filter_35_20]PJA84738.1 MAG: ribonuclease J [Candidatus Nealsonbacteria bacterium CG_4_9_14_3_um_filter_35_11]